MLLLFHVEAELLEVKAAVRVLALARLAKSNKPEQTNKRAGPSCRFHAGGGCTELFFDTMCERKIWVRRRASAASNSGTNYVTVTCM